MQIMTGYTGEPHVTSDMARLLNTGIIGGASYVLAVGENLRAEIENNSSIRILSGVAVHQGCVGVTSKNGYDTVTISNGTQGMRRKDLIVLRYTKQTDTQVEGMEYVVIRGTPTRGTPSEPAAVSGDIAGGALISDMPLYTVELNGINIVSVEKKFIVVPVVKIINDNLNTLTGKVTGLTTDLNSLTSKVTNDIFNGHVRPWSSADWLADGEKGVYWMVPSNNTTNSPFPGRWGWMMNLQTLRIAVPYSTGEVYTNMFANNTWTGWKSVKDNIDTINADLDSIGQTVKTGYWGVDWTLAGYSDVGNKQAVVNNDFFQTDSRWSTVTVKKAGRYIVNVNSLFYCVSSPATAWGRLFINDGETGYAFTAYAQAGDMHFAGTGCWVLDLAAGTRLSYRTAYGAGGQIRGRGQDIMQVTKIK